MHFLQYLFNKLWNLFFFTFVNYILLDLLYNLWALLIFIEHFLRSYLYTLKPNLLQNNWLVSYPRHYQVINITNLKVMKTIWFATSVRGIILKQLNEYSIPGTPSISYNLIKIIILLLHSYETRKYINKWWLSHFYKLTFEQDRLVAATWRLFQ